MAFLYNEDKYFRANNLPSTQKISPGFYIPQSINRKIKKNYAPFGSSSEKISKLKSDYIPLNHSNNIYLFNSNNKFLAKKKYNQLYDNKNELKKIKTKEDMSEELKKNILSNNNSKTKTNSKFIIDANYSPDTGLNSKDTTNYFNSAKESRNNSQTKLSKKVKSLTEIENIDINLEKLVKNKSNKSKKKFLKTMTENWYSRIRTKYNNELLLEFDRDKNLNKNAFVSSIPYKNNSYGYIIEDNGSMTPKENPDAIKVFSGLGKDTVGPGNYDVKLKWNKTLSLWSKSKAERFSPNNTINKNIKKEFEKKMKEKNEYSKTYSSKDWIIKTRNKFNNKHSFKYLPLFRTKDSLISPSGKIITNTFDKPGRSDNFLKNKLNESNPGPGYYYEDNKWSCLKIRRYPLKIKKKYNFGSNVDRFEITNDNYEENNNNAYVDPRDIYRKKLKEMKNKSPLPTTYFKEDIKRTNYFKEKFKCPQKSFCFKHIW